MSYPIIHHYSDCKALVAASQPIPSSCPAADEATGFASAVFIGFMLGVLLIVIAWARRRP